MNTLCNFARNLLDLILCVARISTRTRTQFVRTCVFRLESFFSSPGKGRHRRNVMLNMFKIFANGAVISSTVSFAVALANFIST